MSPLPWRTRRRDAIASAPPEAMRVAVPAAPEPTLAVTRPPAPRMPVSPARPVYRTPVYGTGWTAREAAVLDLLAARGGDLNAHQAVHLEEK